jgi:hypothetical protein
MVQFLSRMTDFVKNIFRIDWLSDWLIDWSIDWLIDWVIDRLIDWLIELVSDEQNLTKMCLLQWEDTFWTRN